MKAGTIKEVMKITRTGGEATFETMRFLTLSQAKREVRAIDPTLCHHRLPVGNVYFIHSKATKAIKIGYSAHSPKVRLRELQTATAEKLSLLGWIAGSRDDERDLHQRFAEYRIRGEWFRYTGELIDYVEALA